MVFEPSYSRVVSSIRRETGVVQSEVSVRLTATDVDSIDSVLSVATSVGRLSSSSIGRDVTVAGVVDFQVVYVSNSNIYTLDYTADFKDKYVVEIDPSGELILSGQILDVSYSIVGRDIKITAIVETHIDEIVNTDTNILTSIKGDEVYVSSEPFTYTTYAGIATDKFDIEESFEIRNATTILQVSPSVKLSNVTSNDKFVTINGSLCVDICYKTGDRVQDISNQNQVFDFVQEIANDGLNTLSNIYSIVDMVTTEMKVVTNQSEGSLKVDMVLPILYRGYIFNDYTIDVIKDVYSSTNYLAITYDSVDIMKSSEVVRFSDKIDGVVAISDTAPFIDEIVGVGGQNIVLTRSEIVDGTHIVEGVASVTSIYYSKETDSLSSVVIDMPFSFDENVVGIDGFDTVTTLAICDITSRSRRGKEIEVTAELYVYTEAFDSEKESLIVDVVEGNKIPFDDCVLTIYIVKQSDTIWSIAKELGVSMDLILSQNPEVDVDNLQVGTRIVVYRPRVAEF